MVSFQGKFVSGLKARNIDVCYDLGDLPYDAVLVIGGTRQLQRLWRVKRRGIPIVQRLDGMNWIHRVLNTGIRHWIRAEYGNIILSNIRASLGSLLGGYEFGLENAIELASHIAYSHDGGQRVELMVVGRVSPGTKEHWESWIGRKEMNQVFQINWLGAVPHDQIAEIYQSAHLFFSADINAACPNSVIEAIACGTPVAAFDTGALAELLGDGGGITVPYGGNPWQLDPPDIHSLVSSALDLLHNLDHYRESARQRALSGFDLEPMVDRYLELLLG
jgi:glycosyltransferase involved in cell wall biosynthesis